MGMVNPNKLGLVLGALYGGWHLLWAMLVGIGWASIHSEFACSGCTSLRHHSRLKRFSPFVHSFLLLSLLVSATSWAAFLACCGIGFTNSSDVSQVRD